MRQSLRSIRDFLTLPAAAQRHVLRDRMGGPGADPGPEAALNASYAWLLRAQAQSTSRDGGVARDYSIQRGWNESYPETTGYIVPTLLNGANRYARPEYRAAAERMLAFLVAQQFLEGGLPGGTVSQMPRVPVTFNTGQILLGFAAGFEHLGEAYRVPTERAANWLANSLDADGAWRKHATPFAKPGDKTYETHVSWGLYEAARVLGRADWTAAASRQVDWAISKQRPNGWLADCCLNDPTAPLTHTLGYALRGFVEAFLHTQEQRFLEAAMRTAEPLARVLRSDGFLAGRWTSDWTPAVTWSCLTGAVQIAHSWLELSRLSGNTALREAGGRAIAYVRRTIATTGNPDLVGGVRGSFPVDGEYGQYQYLNWAAKFFIDAQELELDLNGAGSQELDAADGGRTRRAAG